MGISGWGVALCVHPCDDLGVSLRCHAQGMSTLVLRVHICGRDLGQCLTL
jgi:hypothetical protein